jgi:hypothetical protein
MAPDLRQHLDGLVTAARVFTSPDGRPLHHSNFYRRVWIPAPTITGLSGTHFHDLRHAGNRFTADAGANPCELMERMGHGSDRAALIYLRSSAERQRSLAIEIGKNAKAALGKPDGKPKRSGTRKVHRRGGPLVPAQNLCFAWSELASAPGRIRTRDPLLRRQRPASAVVLAGRPA